MSAWPDEIADAARRLRQLRAGVPSETRSEQARAAVAELVGHLHQHLPAACDRVTIAGDEASGPIEVEVRTNLQPVLVVSRSWADRVTMYATRGLAAGSRVTPGYRGRPPINRPGFVAAVASVLDQPDTVDLLAAAHLAIIRDHAARSRQVASDHVEYELVALHANLGALTDDRLLIDTFDTVAHATEDPLERHDATTRLLEGPHGP